MGTRETPAKRRKWFSVERQFGFAISALLALTAARQLHRHQLSAAAGAVWICAILGLLLVSFLAPRTLAGPTRLWLRLGDALSRIVSPIVLGAIFFLLITPIALVGRLAGRDELRLRRRPVRSYWIEREAPETDPASFTRPF